MPKGYRLWAAGAGALLIIGFFMPWLGKTPFHFSGGTFAVRGYAFLAVLPVSGLAVIGLVLGIRHQRPFHLLYPAAACILTLVLLICVMTFSDTGPLFLQWPSDTMEIIRLAQDSSRIFFHPAKDIGPGLIMSLAGIGILGLIPYGYKNRYRRFQNDPDSYRHVIHEPGISVEYSHFTRVLLSAVILLITYTWCGISPLKLWENRGNAREYLFGRELSQNDLADINTQVQRAPNIEAEGLAREAMSNKYRNIPISQQPGPEEKAAEREVLKQQFLSRMSEDKIRQLKKDVEKNALTEKKGGYFPPETSWPKVEGYVVALIETVAIAVWGTLLAVICAVPVSFFAAKNTLMLIISSDDMTSRTLRSSISFGVRRFLDSCRGFNEFVMALIFVAVIGLGPYAGILALWIHTFGILGKVFSEQIEAIESGQVEALTSTGAGAVQTIAFSVMPQVLPVFVSYTLLRFESNVRSAAILGFVGAGGIGFLIFDKLNGYLFKEVCTMMIIIILTVGIIDHFCGKIRVKFI